MRNRTPISAVRKQRNTIIPLAQKTVNLKLERVEGVEPSYKVWKTFSLPLGDTRKNWWRRRESNPHKAFAYSLQSWWSPLTHDPIKTGANDRT